VYVVQKSNTLRSLSSCHGIPVALLARDNGLAAAALGKPGWQTPHGPFEVVELRRHPVWRAPRSIQREMAMQGKVVKTVVRPGPNK
jgi:hypothetical protein